MIGFPEGKNGLEALERAVAEFSAGNVILFTRNIGQPEAVHALCAEVRWIIRAGARGGAGVEPFISIDQEGGIVARIKEGVTPMPGAMTMAAAVLGGGRSASEVRAMARICGSELGALGINWNLAPVADVNVNPANPVIGVRSFGEDSGLVAELASAYAAGLADAGVLASGKHFPGHGDTMVDSHLGLPLIPHGMGRLEKVELVPFRRLIAAGIPAITTAHVRFPAIEEAALPATLSPRVLTGLLRGELGFRGLILTDCMEMKAIADNFPDAAVMAVKAGVDLIDVSHTYEAQAAAARSIEEAVLRGDIPESRIDESVDRILAAKSRLAPACEDWGAASAALMRPDSLALAEGFSRDSLCLVRGGSGLPAKSGAFVIEALPQIGSLAEERRGEAGLVAAALEGRCPGRFSCASVAVDPSEAEIARAVAAAEGRDVVALIHNASSHPAQVELVEALARRAAEGARVLGIVSTRSPYDAALFRGAASKAPFLCAFEYTRLSAASIAAFLDGSSPARGACPVRLPEGR